MKEYVFRFSNLIESDGEKYNCLNREVYGFYDSEKEAIIDAMRMYEDCGYTFTHLFVGQAEYFIARIDADWVLENLAQLAVDSGFDDDGHLTNVKSKHLRELDKLLTETYLKWENKHPEYRKTDYLMTQAVRYSISELKEEMENLQEGEQDDE